MNVEPFNMKLVVEAVVNDPYVVDDRENLFTPVHVFVSESSVDDAAPDSDVRNPASLLNHDSFTDDEAIVDTSPLLPVNAKPCVSDGIYSVPMLAVVAEAYVNDPRVVDELLNVCRAVNVFVVYVLGIVVEAAMYAFVVLFANVVSRVTLPAEYVRPDENVVVATHVGTPDTSASTWPFVPAERVG